MEKNQELSYEHTSILAFDRNIDSAPAVKQKEFFIAYATRYANKDNTGHHSLLAPILTVHPRDISTRAVDGSCIHNE